MKKFVLLFIGMFMVISVFAQTDFQELTLKEALGKAKVENNYVFVGCYRVWCGPCKVMAEEVLPLKEVGNYMNKKFVCIKVDMEKSEGVDIARKYQVSAYPTFLVLKADGNLLHRVIGASATGEEFIRKVEVGFDENSASNLEEEYVAGNRDMNFLVKYIKALVKAYDIERARKISADVLTSLSDEEKCAESYWFIYENLDLSPVGSNNVAYLFKHIEQFRQKNGVEKVDSVVGNVFAVQLEDILRGRSKEITLEDVGAIENMLVSCRLKGQDYLDDYVALIKAVKMEKTDDVIKLYEKVFSKMDDGRIAYLYFSPIIMLKNKWDEKQKKTLCKLTKKIARGVKSIPIQSSLMSFANIALPQL